MVLSKWREIVNRFCCLILLASFSTVVAATGQETSEMVMLAERPTVNGEPTVIEIGIFVIDIDEIDDVKQHFHVDVFIVAEWQDPRLALPQSERRDRIRFMSFDEAWTPKIMVLNDRGLRTHLREGLEVDDLGNVKVRNRHSGELAADLQFREFPFDVQQLPIDVVSYEHTTDELQFASSSTMLGRDDAYSIEGWHLEQLDPVTGVFIVPADGSKLPRLTYVIEAERDSDYYALTMLVPMALIIFMAWTVFWLQPNMVPPRIAISTASIFSLIALGVSIRLGLPKISYLTKADIFVLGCTLMVFLALGIAVIGSRWANSDRMEQALKANAISRWVYLLLFLVVTLAAFNH